MILVVFCGALGVLEVRIGCSDKMVSFAERSPRGKCFTTRRLPKPFQELYFPFCMALIMAESFESSLHLVIADRHIYINNMAALNFLLYLLIHGGGQNLSIGLSMQYPPNGK
jgi:hypothetical protein